METCPVCGGSNLAYKPEIGEIVCYDCGLIVSERMVDAGRDWRGFDPDEFRSRARTGAAIRPDSTDYNLTSDIQATKESSTMARRLARTQKMIRSVSREKTLRNALRMLQQASAKLNLPRVTSQDAAILYRKASSAGLVKGRSVKSMLAAVVYAACRRTHTPRSMAEVADHFMITEKELGKSLRLLFKRMGVNIPPPSPSDYIPVIASKLGLPDKLIARSLQIVKMAREKGITTGKEPWGISAAAIYLACQEAGIHRTQREISLAAGVTEVTIRNRSRELLEKVFTPM